MRRAGGVLHVDDLLEDRQEVARQERPAVDDHVDLVGAGLDGRPRLGELDVAERLPRREAGGDAGDLDRRALEGLLRLGDEGRVDADRGDRRDGRVARLRVHRLDAHRPDLARRVLPLEGGQVHHPDRQVERPHLRGLLDRPALERVDALLDADLVDGRDPSQQAPEGSRAGVPRGDQLVRALASDGVRTAGRGHGRRRIHPSLTRVTRLVRHSRHEPVRPAARRARALPAGPQRARRLRRLLGRDARRRAVGRGRARPLRARRHRPALGRDVRRDVPRLRRPADPRLAAGPGRRAAAPSPAW